MGRLLAGCVWTVAIGGLLPMRPELTLPKPHWTWKYLVLRLWCKACLTPLYEVSFVLLLAHHLGYLVLGSAAQKPNAEEACNGEPYTPAWCIG